MCFSLSFLFYFLSQLCQVESGWVKNRCIILQVGRSRKAVIIGRVVVGIKKIRLTCTSVLGTELRH